MVIFKSKQQIKDMGFENLKQILYMGNVFLITINKLRLFVSQVETDDTHRIFFTAIIDDHIIEHELDALDGIELNPIDNELTEDKLDIRLGLKKQVDNVVKFGAFKRKQAMDSDKPLIPNIYKQTVENIEKNRIKLNQEVSRKYRLTKKPV
jgi:hypothetical protein